MAASGAVTGIAWGLTMLQVSRVGRCQSAMNDGTIDSTPAACLFDSGDDVLASATALKSLANLGNWALAGTAGGVRGNWAGTEHAWQNRPSRNTGMLIGVGATLAAVGLLGSAASLGALGNECKDGDCTRRIATYLVAQQVSQSTMAVGLGMFGYGLVYRWEYKENAELLRRNRLTVTPTISASFAGASMSARF